MGVENGDGDADRALVELSSPALDALFQPQARTGVPSAWHGHVPFAQWLVAAIRPGAIVELGTHNGVSYSAFCETVLRERLATRCYAVDSWAGDDHAGHYGEAVYTELRAFHDARYGAFSELLRMTFDEARAMIGDGTVDLLHIDGFHGYEAVRHDFESWMPKLSARAVVLFHDTNVLERGFGVARFWAEIRDRYPAFEFLHGHGLGVLAVGEAVPAAVRSLCDQRDPAAIAVLRDRFAALARAHVLEFALREALRQQEQKWQSEVDALRQSLGAAEAARDRAEAARGEAQEAAARTAEGQVRTLEALRLDCERERIEYADRLERLQAERASERDALFGHLAAARADVQAVQARCEALESELARAAVPGRRRTPVRRASPWATPLGDLWRRLARHPATS